MLCIDQALPFGCEVDWKAEPGSSSLLLHWLVNVGQSSPSKVTSLPGVALSLSLSLLPLTNTLPPNNDNMLIEGYSFTTIVSFLFYIYIHTEREREEKILLRKITMSSLRYTEVKTCLYMTTPSRRIEKRNQAKLRSHRVPARR